MSSTDLVVIRDTTRKPKKTFAPEDFRTQLWYVARSAFNEITERAAIAWGQDKITLIINKSGRINNGAFFDCPAGGEELWKVNVRHSSGLTMPVLYPGDHVVITGISWP